MNEENVVTTTARTDISDEARALIEASAQKQLETEVDTVPFLSTKGKKFTLGEEKLGNILNVVILADVFDHSYYDRPYDPDVINPPVCFAINSVNSELAPHQASPVAQAASCGECSMNEFGSASNGKGKACRNGRRLLVAATTNGEPDLGNLAIINLAPTSLKGYAKYAKSLAAVKKLPIWAVITTLSFDDDATWPQVVTNFNGVLDGNYINIIAPRLAEFAETVAVPYDTTNYEAAPAQAQDSAKKSKMS